MPIGAENMNHDDPDDSDRSDPSDRSDRSDPSDASHRHLRPSGGYRRLRSFQTATVVYDATVSFCERFLDERSRTFDQMVQAARSGRQNIAEGSRASATSSQTELRLVNVARSSLDELLLDYEDFLRQRGHRLWGKDDPEALKVRRVGKEHRTDPTDRSDLSDRSDQSVAAAYASWLDHPDPAVVANATICLIHQANYLLDHQLTGMEQQFIEGGYSESLAAARPEHRQKKDQPDSTDQPAPACPLCGKPMRQRTARRGKHAGTPFWGCSGYPECKGTRPTARSDQSDRSDL